MGKPEFANDKNASGGVQAAGWEGGVRAPCLMPDAAAIAAFGEGPLALGVPEFDAVATSAMADARRAFKA